MHVCKSILFLSFGEQEYTTLTELSDFLKTEVINKLPELKPEIGSHYLPLLTISHERSALP